MEVLTVLSVSFFPDGERNVDCIVYVDWEIFKLLWQSSVLFRRVLDQSILRVERIETNFIINVFRKGFCELG